MTKKRIAKGRPGGWDGTDPLGIRDIGNDKAYMRATQAVEGKNDQRSRNAAAQDLANRVVPNVTVSTDSGSWNSRNAAGRAFSDVLAGGKNRQSGSVVTMTTTDKPRTSSSSFNPQNAGGKGARKMAKNIKSKEDAQRWMEAAPQMERANARRPMVVEQMPSGMIMGRDTKAKATASRGAGARKASAATSLAKNQGAYINGKPASADLTKVRERNPHGGRRKFAKKG